jgi:hypothetical protein
MRPRRRHCARLRIWTDRVEPESSAASCHSGRAKETGRSTPPRREIAESDIERLLNLQSTSEK